MGAKTTLKNDRDEDVAFKVSVFGGESCETISTPLRPFSRWIINNGSSAAPARWWNITASPAGSGDAPGFLCILRVRRLLRKLRSERLGEFFRGVSVAPPQPAIRPTRFIFTLFINCLLARNLALGALYLPKSYFGTAVIFDDRVLKFIVGQDPKNPFMICLCAAPTFV